MEFVCYTDWDQLPKSANALFEKGEKDSVFLSRPWFESLVATALDDDHSMVLACVVARGKVMAMLPLMEYTGVNIWYSLRHAYTPIYSLLVLDDDQEQVLNCLVQALRELPVKGLLLEPVADDDSKLIGFQKLMESAGFNCTNTFRHYNWIYRLHGQSYADYMATRPAHLRNTIARKRRKLEREHGFEIRLYTGDEVPQHMADYYAVYNASWKQSEIGNTEFLKQFVERFSLVRSSGASSSGACSSATISSETISSETKSSEAGFSRVGWSRLAILYIKGQPVAAQLWFVCHGKASIFRLAYDKAWRRYSTGSILTSFMMEYVIDTDKVNEIDFLTGNDAYKQDWMSERRERFLLSCIKSPVPTSRVKQFLELLRKKPKNQKTR